MNLTRIQESYAILDRAWAEHRPRVAVAMFSGGYDSLATTHLTMTWAADRGYPAKVAHLITGTGIRETHDYVRQTCATYGWSLVEYDARQNVRADGTPDPQDYESMVLSYGFPGPWMHRKMYSRLKERSIERLIREHKQVLTDCILLASGKRRQESARRTRTTTLPHERLGARLWANPLIDWSKDDVLDYKALHGLPNNMVVDLLHRSGECNCGAFAQPGELDEMELWFPETGCWLRKLEARVKAAGFPWGWEEAPPEWWGKIDMTPERWAAMTRTEQLQILKGQPNLWDALRDELGGSPLCSTCDARFETQTWGYVAPRMPTFIVPIHISLQREKRACMLRTAPLLADPYHTTIASAAVVLDRVPDLLDYVYLTQYSSGATIWRAPASESTVLVRSDGQVIR